MNSFDVNFDLPGAIFSTTVATERGFEITITSVDMSASLYG